MDSESNHSKRGKGAKQKSSVDKTVETSDRKLQAPKYWRRNYGNNISLMSGIYISRSPREIPMFESEVGKTADKTDDRIIPFPFDDGHHSELADEIWRFFPTIHFPAGAFDSTSGPDGVDAWIKLFRAGLEQAAEMRVATKPPKKGAMRPSEQTARSVQIMSDIDDMSDLLSFIEREAQRESLNAAILLGVASAAYYLGRLAERFEIRGVEDAVLSGKQNEKRKTAAAAGTRNKKPRSYSEHIEYSKKLIEKGVNYTTALDRAAEHFGDVTARTLSKYFKNPAPKNKDKTHETS